MKDDQKSLMAFFHVYDFEVIMLNHRVPWYGGDGGISSLNVELLEHFIVMDHICPSMIQDGHVNQNFFFIMADHSQIIYDLLKANLGEIRTQL